MREEMEEATNSSERAQRIAKEMALPEQILQIIKGPAQPRPLQNREFVAPRTETERKLAELWAELLELESVGVNDDFFALGGHSLMATQILSRVRGTFDVEVPLTVLFAQTFTVAELAKQVEFALIANADPNQAKTVLDVIGRMSDREVEAKLAEHEHK